MTQKLKNPFATSIKKQVTADALNPPPVPPKRWKYAVRSSKWEYTIAGPTESLVLLLQTDHLHRAHEAMQSHKGRCHIYNNESMVIVAEKK